MANLMEKIFLANIAHQASIPFGTLFQDELKLPEAQVADAKCRALEAELASRFEEILSNYKDGLIPASQLIPMLVHEAYKE